MRALLGIDFCSASEARKEFKNFRALPAEAHRAKAGFFYSLATDG
jgi:hypothetical protein